MMERQTPDQATGRNGKVGATGGAPPGSHDTTFGMPAMPPSAAS